MGVETRESGLAATEDNENAASEREQQIRELTEQLSKIEREGGGPVLGVVQECANGAGGLVNPTSKMRLHLFARDRLRDLLANEPDDETVNKMQTALAIFNEEQATTEELADPNTAIDYSSEDRGIQRLQMNNISQEKLRLELGGVLAAETLANRISLDRDRRIRELLGLVS